MLDKTTRELIADAEKTMEWAALTPRERAARSRKARGEAGGRQITVMLTPEASEALADLQWQGEGISSAINGLLIRSRPGA